MVADDVAQQGQHGACLQHDREDVFIGDADDVAALEKASAEGGHKIHPPPSLRVGDLFAMLVEHAYGVDKDAAAAFGYLETMKARGIQIVHFVDDDLTRDIARDVRKECV